MLLLPLVVSVPAYIFDEMENKVIDRNHLEDKRAEVLSAYNMGVNLVEVIREKVKEFVGDMEQYDDITTLCFKYLGNG